jgi:hypothetical protein
METQVIEIEGTWEEIAEQVHRFAGRRLRLTVLPDRAGGSSETNDARSLEEKIAAIVAAVPEAEWEKLPADLSDNLDHYIYGTRSCCTSSRDARASERVAFMTCSSTPAPRLPR